MQNQFSNKEDLINWSRNFLTLWEANVSQAFTKEIQHAYYGFCLTSTDGDIGMKLLVTTKEHHQEIDPCPNLAGTRVPDIKALNLSTITIGRILAVSGGTRLVERGEDSIVVSGHIGTSESAFYHLIIQKVG